MVCLYLNIFCGKAGHINTLLNAIAAQDEDENPIRYKRLNDWEVCGEEAEDDVGDKVVHSIDSARISH